MNRIDQKFADLKKAHRKGFIAYICAGDPDLDATAELAVALEKAGVDILEIGIPFSDPLADGIVNQEASQRALAKGTTVDKVLKTIQKIRQMGCTFPIVLYSYYNPIFHYGMEKFIRDAKQAGVDGLLNLEMPPEESGKFEREMSKQEVHSIFLIAPTSSDERIRKISEKASGFIYYVSREGVTGERSSMENSIESMVKKIRKYSKLPVVVGFGVSKPDHVREIAKLADAVVVGSSIVKKIGAIGKKPNLIADIAKHVEKLVEPLKNKKVKK
jgi:tryptophan synthase alpha chain